VGYRDGLGYGGYGGYYRPGLGLAPGAVVGGAIAASQPWYGSYHNPDYSTGSYSPSYSGAYYNPGYSIKFTIHPDHKAHFKRTPLQRIVSLGPMLLKKSGNALSRFFRKKRS